jgi:GNAT superfamily N-acetyltransferase
MPIQSNAPLVRLRMECHDLNAVPRHTLPPPFSLRRFRPGDIDTWFHIESAAERYQPITRALFEHQFGTDPDLLAQRQFYLCDPHGHAIGTATAWFDTSDPARNWGRVHWVAILPTWQGRGLSKPLLAAVCERLRQLGHVRAYLMTETVRTTAISLYRQFGFVPADADHLAP